jgi:hypothetical protein
VACVPAVWTPARWVPKCWFGPLGSPDFWGGAGVNCAPTVGFCHFQAVWCKPDFPDCGPIGSDYLVADPFGCYWCSGTTAPAEFNIRNVHWLINPGVLTCSGCSACTIAFEFVRCGVNQQYFAATDECCTHAACPPGEHWDPWAEDCKPDCRPGECWCDSAADCVPCPPPSICWAYLGCHWDTATCDWDCPAVPACPPGEHWSAAHCRCETCPAGECWCDGLGMCVACPDPECKVERGCVWNEGTCDWDCTPPTCPAGYTFQLSTCACEPDCPPGECWCNGLGACVSCPDPDCKEELHCVWDRDLCDWVCDDPETICGPGRTWNATLCRCEGGDGVDLIETQGTFLHLAYREGNDIRVQQSKDRGDTWSSGLTVASDGADDAAPALARDPQDTLWLAYHTAADAFKLWRSADGVTWTLHLTEPGYRFPRLAFLADGRLLTGLTGATTGNLTLHYASEPGATSLLPTGIAFGADPFGDRPPEQRVCLVVDRHDTAHLVYEEFDGSLVHQWSRQPFDLARWSSAAVLTASGEFASFAVGERFAAVAWFVGAALTVELLSSDYFTLLRTVDDPGPTFSPLWGALLWDHDDDLWYLGRAASTGHALLPCYSTDDGANWTVLAGGGI